MRCESKFDCSDNTELELEETVSRFSFPSYYSFCSTGPKIKLHDFCIQIWYHSFALDGSRKVVTYNYILTQFIFLMKYQLSAYEKDRKHKVRNIKSHATG